MVDAAPAGVDPLKTDTPGSDEPPPPRPPSPVKKRRGRPRKSDTNGGAAAAAATPARRARKRKLDPLSPPQVDGSLVGQPVHGVLDGSFDAGYILTVRVGETDTILRGVVFGPGLCVPITKANDIAPNVRFAGSGRGAAAGVAAAAAHAAAAAGGAASAGASRLSSPVLASSATPSSSQQAFAVAAAADNTLAFVDVSSSRHHTPVMDPQQQQHHQHQHQQHQQQQQVGVGFAATIFGVQSSSAGFIDAGKLAQASGQQQQEDHPCSLQLANGSSPQREQQQQQQTTQAETPIVVKDATKDTAVDRP